MLLVQDIYLIVVLIFSLLRRYNEVVLVVINNNHLHLQRHIFVAGPKCT